MFRFLFPSFEKPVDRPRYINIEQEGRDFRGVGVVFLLAAVCGVGFALWEPSHLVTTPFATASAPRAAPAAKISETTAAAAESDAEQIVAPTVKLSTQCAQRATARRDCAGVKAFKDARLNAPEPAVPVNEPKPEVAAAKGSPEPAVASQPSPAIAEAPAPAETPATQTQKTAATPKAKRPHPAEEAPVERLVRVYDQVLPDGRRVPVYRRAGTGSLEMGAIVDGEYRPSGRRANLDPPFSRNFGLQ